MYKLSLISICISFAFFLTSCNNGAQKVSNKNGNNAETFSGTFSGTTPCADCPGIKTTVSFDHDSTFIEHMEYLERNTSYSDTGKWAISDRLITVTFPSQKSFPERFYKITSDSTVAILDGDKKEIEGVLAKYYVLNKLVE